MSAKENRLGPKKFIFEDLERITEEFSEEKIIGRGGFGIVYKGKKDNGEFIAVKMLNQTQNGQIDDTQFKKEVLNVMRISHPNIGRLEGYCNSKDEEIIPHKGTHILVENQHKLICFEYLPSGSLHSYLNNEDKCRVPNWNERYNIIKGICKGLHYLHEGPGGEHILHLDLKPANVLLDKNMTPKIADFGQSRLWLHNERQIHTTKFVWTPGYMPPEYVGRGVLSKKTDVYSLGVIIMETIAGERKYPNEELDEVREKWKETSALGREEYEQIEKCIKLALDCMEKDPEKRLDMKQVIEILGITEDDHRHPDGIEEYSVVDIDSSEVDPLLEERHGPIRRCTMAADKKSSPPEILERRTTTAVTVRTSKFWRRMLVDGWPLVLGLPLPLATIALVGSLVGGLVIFSVMFSKAVSYQTSYEMSQTVSITVEEASFTRFALATSSPVLTYDFSVMMGIYNPSMYKPTVTKPLEAAFFFDRQRFHVVRVGNNGESLITKLISLGPLSGNVTLDTAGVAEYRNETSAGSLFEVELVVVGQVMYESSFKICNVQATCPFKLRLAPPDGATQLELFHKVSCPLHRNCSSFH